MTTLLSESRTRIPQPATPRRILVVDDEAMVRRMLAAVLEAEGFEVRTVGSVAAAMELVRDWSPELVISDVCMPDATGYDLCRDLPIFADLRVPVILVSGLGAEHDITDGYDAGAVDYLLKPWREEELLAKVRRHLAARAKPTAQPTSPVVTVGRSRYSLDRAAGVGGMGTVFEGHDQVTGERVAIKLLRADLAIQPEFVARFLREARLLAGLQLPGIPAVYDVGREREYYYYVMEFIDGVTLTDRVKAAGPLPADEVARIGVQLAATLELLEANGLVHRDLKPDNVVCRPDGTVSLVDFGLARRLADARFTAPDCVLGTAGYVPPEQIYGDVNPDIRGDLYALAMTLWFAATGKHPSSGNALKPAREFDAGDFARALRTADRGLAKLLQQCAAHQPKRRPKTARKAHAAFRRVTHRLAPLGAA